MDVQSLKLNDYLVKLEESYLSRLEQLKILDKIDKYI